MRVVGLVGKSGTGKSTVAIEIAKQQKIDYIIDDGILIKVEDRSVVEGISAKGFDFFKDFTKVMSLVLFIEVNNSSRMINAIESNNVNNLLILGTSKNMVNIIKNNLLLPELEKVININDVTSKEDIEAAKNARETNIDRNHTIPVRNEDVSKALGEFNNCFQNTPCSVKELQAKIDAVLSIS